MSTSLTVSTPRRVIMYNGQELTDFNPTQPVTVVARMHEARFPELATAVAEGPVLADGIATYTIQTRLGTKG